MMSVKQEHVLGCAVACVAAIVNTTYKEALQFFQDGEFKAGYRGFYCPEIIAALAKRGLQFEYRYVKNTPTFDMHDDAHIIVFIKPSSKYPGGHYLCKVGDMWMDPWINFPKLNAKAGFRKELPGDIQYIIKAHTS